MRESDIIALFAPEIPQTKFKTSLPDQNASPRDSATLANLDDCARIDAETIVTTDTLVESTHFRLDWSAPEDLACKLWNVNLSDIAASGGEPEWCLLNLGVPAHISDDWLRRFAVALRTELNADLHTELNADLSTESVQSQLKARPVRLLGGDTFRAPHLVLTLTLAGRLPVATQPEPRQITRSGGRADDGIYVTGAPGLSLLGYEILSGRRPEISTNDPVHAAAIARHLRPRARMAWSRELRDIPEIHSMLDVSDGVYADLIRLAAANPKLSFEIDWERLPLPAVLAQSPSFSEQRLPELRELVLASGEELELLFTAPPGLTLAFPCTEIGRVGETTERDPADRVLLKGAPWTAPPRWFQHF